MNEEEFFQRYYTYIYSTATVKAVDIVQKTGVNDLEDFRQDILVFLAQRIRHYSPKKGKPKTYINVCMESARKNIIRDLYRRRTAPTVSAVPVDALKDALYAMDSRAQRIAEMQEYVQALPPKERDICGSYLFDCESLTRIGRRYRVNAAAIAAIIREAMAPWRDL